MVKCQTEAQHISTLRISDTSVCSRLMKVCFLFWFLNLIFTEIENVTVFMVVKCKENRTSIVLCEMLH